MPPHLRVKVAARRFVNHKDRFWIVSPNMSYIPEQPGLMDQPDVMRDGLLGIYEWTEHPRNYLYFRPHEAVIRVTPVDLAEKTVLTRALRKHDLIWENIRPVGVICASLQTQIEEDYQRVMDAVETRMPHAMKTSTLPHHSRQHALLTRLHLQQKSLVWGHAVAFWRQWQRSVRDLWAWCRWHDLMKRVTLDPKPALDVNTEFRGVFTGDPNVVKMSMFLGIPVWYIVELQAPLPASCVVPIRSWQLNPRLDTNSAEDDYTIPDMFRSVFDIYGPFRLPFSINERDRSLVISRKNTEYSSEIIQNVRDSARAESPRHMDGWYLVF